MKILKVTKENEQYYSLDFIRGYNLGAKQQAEIMPERKKGSWWTNVYDEHEDFLYWECSECGERYMPPHHRANFCPNCGADMRGESDE